MILTPEQVKERAEQCHIPITGEGVTNDCVVCVSHEALRAERDAWEEYARHQERLAAKTAAMEARERRDQMQDVEAAQFTPAEPDGTPGDEQDPREL